MPRVAFLQSEVVSQMYGSDREHLVAVVTVEVKGKRYDCELRQDDGESRNFDETELNVTIPEPLRSMVQYDPFRIAAQTYHRRFGAGGGAAGFNLEGKEHIAIKGIGFKHRKGRYIVDIPGADEEE